MKLATFLVEAKPSDEERQVLQQLGWPDDRIDQMKENHLDYILSKNARWPGAKNVISTTHPDAYQGQRDDLRQIMPHLHLKSWPTKERQWTARWGWVLALKKGKETWLLFRRHKLGTTWYIQHRKGFGVATKTVEVAQGSLIELGVEAALAAGKPIDHKALLKRAPIYPSKASLLKLLKTSRRFSDLQATWGLDSLDELADAWLQDVVQPQFQKKPVDLINWWSEGDKELAKTVRVLVKWFYHGEKPVVPPAAPLAKRKK